MSVVSDFRERVDKAFEAPRRDGIVGLVDDLLDLAGQEGLMLNWQDGRCCVRSLNDDSPQCSEVLVSKAVFRGALARVAALCNEQKADSVSLYGGDAELAPSASRIALRVAFANRPDEQWLKIARA